MNENSPYSLPVEPEVPTSPPKTPWENTQEKASDALRAGERYVTDYPVPSVFTLLLIGFVLGRLVGRELVHHDRSSYFPRGIRRGW